MCRLIHLTPTTTNVINFFCQNRSNVIKLNQIAIVQVQIVKESNQIAIVQINQSNKKKQKYKYSKKAIKFKLIEMIFSHGFDDCASQLLPTLLV